MPALHHQPLEIIPCFNSSSDYEISDFSTFLRRGLRGLGYLECPHLNDLIELLIFLLRHLRKVVAPEGILDVFLHGLAVELEFGYAGFEALVGGGGDGVVWHHRALRQSRQRARL